MKLSLLLSLVLLCVVTSAETLPSNGLQLRATVEGRQVRRGEIFEVKLRMINCSTSKLRYSDFSCTWSDSWKVVSPHLGIAQTSPRAKKLTKCPSNALTIQDLLPVEALEESLLVYVKPTAPAGRLRFKLQRVRSPKLVSAPLEIAIIPERLQPTPAREAFDLALMMESMIRFDEAVPLYTRARQVAGRDRDLAEVASRKIASLTGKPNQNDPVPGNCK